MVGPDGKRSTPVHAWSSDADVRREANKEEAAKVSKAAWPEWANEKAASMHCGV